MTTKSHNDKSHWRANLIGNLPDGETQALKPGLVIGIEPDPRMHQMIIPNRKCYKFRFGVQAWRTAQVTIQVWADWNSVDSTVSTSGAPSCQCSLLSWLVCLAMVASVASISGPPNCQMCLTWGPKSWTASVWFWVKDMSKASMPVSTEFSFLCWFVVHFHLQCSFMLNYTWWQQASKSSGHL